MGPHNDALVAPKLSGGVEQSSYGQLFAGSATMTPQSLMHQPSPFFGLNSGSGVRLHSGTA